MRNECTLQHPDHPVRIPFSQFPLPPGAPDRAARRTGDLLLRAARRVAGMVGDTLARMKARARARRTMDALAALDARTLRDLGLHRSEIPSVAAEFTARDLYGHAPTRVHVLHAWRGLW